MGIPYAEVIGDPIDHSKSPLIHKFWLDKLGVEGDYRAVRVTSDELPDYFASRRSDPEWHGCNVTLPHKLTAVPLMDRLFEAATVTGAVNTVFNLETRLVGNNTDPRGFAEPFRHEYGERGSALVIGTGGAARAVFIALAALGFGPVELAGRDVGRAQALLDALGQRIAARSLEAPLPRVDLLVNASAAGMKGFDSLSLDLAPLPPSAIVYDIVYDPLETSLMKCARQRGLRTIDGLAMLVGQAAASFCHFFPGQPPRQHDRELRGLLTA